MRSFTPALKNLLFFYLFFLPFVFYTGNAISPFEVPRLAFSACIAVLGSLFFILENVRLKKISFIWNRALTLISVIVIANLLSYCFSINPTISFWGDSFLPADSVLTVILFFTLSFLFLQVTESYKDMQMINDLVCSGATVLAFYGVIQHFDLDFVLWWRGAIAGGKPIGTLGQHVNFATYLGAFLPLFMFNFFSASKIRRYFYGFALVCIPLSLFYSSSRMPIGLSAATSFFVLIYLVYSKQFAPLLKKATLVLLIFSFAAALIFAERASVFSENKFSGKIISKAVNSRLLIWQAGLQALKQNPVLGSGPETFYIVERIHQSKEMNSYEYWDKYWAKAHNQWIQFLVSLGLFGLFSHLLFFAAVGFSTLRLFLQRKVTPENFIGPALALGLLFIEVSNLTAFNFMTSQFYCCLFAVLFFWEPKKMELQLNRRLSVLLTTIITISVLWLGISVLNFWRADLYYEESRVAKDTFRNFISSLDLVDKAIDLQPQAAFFCHKADILATLLKKDREHMSLADQAKVLGEVDNESQSCVNFAGFQHKYILARALLFSYLYNDGIVDSIQISESAFDELQKYNPNNPFPLFMKGLLYKKTARTTDFLTNMQKAISLKADYLPAYMELLKYNYERNDQQQIKILIDSISGTTFGNEQSYRGLLEIKKLCEQNKDAASASLVQQTYEKSSN